MVIGQYLPLQGVLSGAVCWDVLEEQLFYSKIGYDERRREVFRQVVEKHHGYNHSETLTAPVEGAKEAYTGPSYSNSTLWQMSAGSNTLRRPQNVSPVLKRKRGKFSPHEETVGMMRTALDQATHLRNYPVPLDPELAIYVAAKDDLYIPRRNVTDVRSIWPGKVACGDTFKFALNEPIDPLIGVKVGINKITFLEAQKVPYLNFLS